MDSHEPGTTPATGSGEAQAKPKYLVKDRSQRQSQLIGSPSQVSPSEQQSQEQKPELQEPSGFQPKDMQEVWRYYRTLDLESKARKELRAKLFEKYYPYCQKSVKFYMDHRMPSYSLVDEVDLLQFVGRKLVLAIDLYDPDRGTTFTQFFNARNKSMLRGAILDCLRSLQEFPRPVAKSRREIYHQWEDLTHRLGKKPTIEEYLDFYGWTEDNIKRVKDPLLFAKVYNQPQKVSSGNSEDEDFNPLLNVVDPVSDPAAEIVRDAITRQESLLSCISDENIRRTVLYYYWMDKTHSEIAKAEHCSPSTIMERRVKGVKIIDEHFTHKTFLKAIGHDVKE